MKYLGLEENKTDEDTIISRINYYLPMSLTIIWIYCGHITQLQYIHSIPKIAVIVSKLKIIIC